MPERPGCDSTSGEIAVPSRVPRVSTNAVDTVRFSSDGRLLHPLVTLAIKQSTVTKNA
jgi:hypothetical protein